MKYISHYYKKLKVKSIKIAILAVIVSIFFLPSYVSFEHTGNNMFTISLDGVIVGVVNTPEEADKYLREARKQIAGNSQELVLADSDIEAVGSEVLWGKIDPKEQVIGRMCMRH